MSLGPPGEWQVEKRCFAYCGDDRCTCDAHPMNSPFGLLTVPELTPEQRDYLDKAVKRRPYDPATMIRGRKPPKGLTP